MERVRRHYPRVHRLRGLGPEGPRATWQAGCACGWVGAISLIQDEAHLLGLAHQLEMQPVRCAGCGDVDYSQMLTIRGELWILCRGCYLQHIQRDLQTLCEELTA